MVGCRDGTGRRGKNFYISTHTLDLNTFTGEGGGGGPAPFETARVPNPWLSLGGSQSLVSQSCYIILYDREDPYQLLRSQWQFSRKQSKEIRIVFKLNSRTYPSRKRINLKLIREIDIIQKI